MWQGQKCKWTTQAGSPHWQGYQPQHRVCFRKCSRHWVCSISSPTAKWTPPESSFSRFCFIASEGLSLGNHSLLPMPILEPCFLHDEDQELWISAALKPPAGEPPLRKVQAKHARGHRDFHSCKPTLTNVTLKIFAATITSPNPLNFEASQGQFQLICYAELRGIFFLFSDHPTGIWGIWSVWGISLASPSGPQDRGRSRQIDCTEFTIAFDSQLMSPASGRRVNSAGRLGSLGMTFLLQGAGVYMGAWSLDLESSLQTFLTSVAYSVGIFKQTTCVNAGHFFQLHQICIETRSGTTEQHRQNPTKIQTCSEQSARLLSDLRPSDVQNLPNVWKAIFDDLLHCDIKTSASCCRGEGCLKHLKNSKEHLRNMSNLLPVWFEAANISVDEFNMHSAPKLLRTQLVPVAVPPPQPK